jgi:hypothetical protein
MRWWRSSSDSRRGTMASISHRLHFRMTRVPRSWHVYRFLGLRFLLSFAVFFFIYLCVCERVGKPCIGCVYFHASVLVVVLLSCKYASSSFTFMQVC